MTVVDSGRKYSFMPVIGTSPLVLILGSLPGDRSLMQGQYYAHPRNSFWPIINHLIGPLPNSYQERVELLKSCHFALWDVCHSATRTGSLDHEIMAPVANDIRALLSNNQTIKQIWFNGQSPYKLYKAMNHAEPPIAYRILASTSPAHTIPFERKLAIWQEAYQALLR